MNKMGLKILAIGCILLLVSSLFLPILSYTGYSTTIFDGNKELNYFPYILIGFSLISIIVILLKKYEFTYLLLGSSFTFIITTTIGSIDNFKYFSIGYYLMVISSIVLFIILLFLKLKNKENSVVDVKQDVVSKIEDSINFDNIEPNELAKSIMDEPVMNNEFKEPQIDFSEISNEEVSLAPQNPLNSFLPSDFDPSKIVKKENNDIKIEDKIEDNKFKIVEKLDDNMVKEDNSQSIMSVMSQPMVSNNIPQMNNQQSNNIPQMNNQQNNNIPTMEAGIPDFFNRLGNNGVQNQNSSMVQSKINSQSVNSSIPYPDFTQNSNQ